MRFTLIAALIAACFTVGAYAQPRPVEKSTTVPANTPDTFEARYEGGLFGSTRKEKGVLRFDDANERLVFSRKNEQGEMFTIPYDALVVVYPDSRDSVPQAGKVVGALPLPGAGLAGLFSKSTKYVNMSFDDPDIEAKGTASFRFDKKDMLLAFIAKLGSKANMVQRGDAYYKRKSRAVF